MNFSDFKSLKINGQQVTKLVIDGNVVWENVEADVVTDVVSTKDLMCFLDARDYKEGIWEDRMRNHNFMFASPITSDNGYVDIGNGNYAYCNDLMSYGKDYTIFISCYDYRIQLSNMALYSTFYGSKYYTLMNYQYSDILQNYLVANGSGKHIDLNGGYNLIQQNNKTCYCMVVTDGIMKSYVGSTTPQVSTQYATTGTDFEINKTYLCYYRSTYRCKLGSFRSYNRALTQEEVEKLFEYEATIDRDALIVEEEKEQGLIASYNYEDTMKDGANSYIFDATGNGYNLPIGYEPSINSQGIYIERESSPQITIPLSNKGFTIKFKIYSLDAGNGWRYFKCMSGNYADSLGWWLDVGTAGKNIWLKNVKYVDDGNFPNLLLKANSFNEVILAMSSNKLTLYVNGAVATKDIAISNDLFNDIKICLIAHSSYLQTSKYYFHSAKIYDEYIEPLPISND